MKVDMKSAMYAMFYGAGPKRTFKVLKDNNKRVPARAVKKAFKRLTQATCCTVHDEIQFYF